jgi:hypothetical protein
MLLETPAHAEDGWLAERTPSSVELVDGRPIADE